MGPIIPAIILDGPLESKASLAMRLVENLHREDLDPIDEAEACAEILGGYCNGLQKIGTKKYGSC